MPLHRVGAAAPLPVSADSRICMLNQRLRLADPPVAVRCSAGCHACIAVMHAGESALR